MVVGVPGLIVVYPVVLELRQEHALIQHLHMEDLSVMDLQKKVALHDHVLVIFLGLL